MPPLASSTLHVDLAAYRHNLNVVRSSIPEACGIIAVVKSNAYGLGMIEIAKRAVTEKVSMLAVATVGEGLALREAFPEFPILVLVQPAEKELIHAIRKDLKLTVSDYATAEKIGDLAAKARKVAEIHCEIDTGMGRQGFPADDAAKSLLKITRISNVDIEAVSTHFPSAEDVDDPFTENQVRSFRQLLRNLSRDGIPYEFGHAANSAGILLHPGSAFDMVRPGIMTYGVWPDNRPPENNPLKPVVRWTSTLVLIKNMPGGVSISYGRTYRTEQPIRTGVIPIGYADGYPRMLSNNADVLIRGKRCPVRGTVTMNQVIVDLSSVPDAAVGDPVTLIGRDGKEQIRVEELAERAKTIGFEILTRIASSVHREYLSA